MNIRKVKQGAKITFYNGIYMILFGIFYTIFVRFNMNQNFKAIGELWGFFARFNPEITQLFLLFNILIGLFLISTGITIIHLSDFIIKRKDKMTWVILFLSGLIAWVGLLIISFLFKNIPLIILSIIGWIMFIFGMLLPIQYYMEKSYREY
jgi:uncharacterized membrane protein HdeD (DUF308 family)|tara:strand:- start:11412 stop:11864 length:453 start_codon:yes stop_codon:yes gene_type:complete